MSLRSRNIKTFLTSSSPVKTSPVKTQALKTPPLEEETLKQLHIGFTPETPSRRILRNSSIKTKMSSFKRPAMELTDFPTQKKGKLENTSSHISDYSSEDETPLKFIPKQNDGANAGQCTGDKPTEEPAPGFSGWNDASDNKLVDVEAELVTEVADVLGHDLLDKLMEEMATSENYKLLIPKIDEFNTNNEVPDIKIEAKEEVGGFMEANTGMKVNTRSDQIPSTKDLNIIKNEVYDFDSEGENDPPPILGFQTKRRSLNSLKNETTSYINVSKVTEDFVIEQKAVDIPGKGRELRCKLVLRKDLDSMKTVDKKTNSLASSEDSGVCETLSMDNITPITKPVQSSKCLQSIVNKAAAVVKPAQVNKSTESGTSALLVKAAPIAKPTPVVKSTSAIKFSLVVKTVPIQSAPAVKSGPAQPSLIVKVAPIQCAPEQGASVAKPTPVGKSEPNVKITSVVKFPPIVKVGSIQSSPIVQLSPVKSGPVQPTLIIKPTAIQPSPVVKLSPVMYKSLGQPALVTNDSSVSAIPNTECDVVNTMDEAMNTLPSCSTKSESTIMYSEAASTSAQFKIAESMCFNNKTEFPGLHHPPCSVEAPVFRPTEAEFQDPLRYIESISTIASKFGLCKIVPPKSSSESEPFLPTDIKFTAHNHYIHRMYQRWGPATREFCAIKKYLVSQGVPFRQQPLIDGVEMNLPGLFHSVQRNGGLKEVLDKLKWSIVARECSIPNISKRLCSMLDRLYVKYLLPYDTLTPADRQKVFVSVDKEWARKYSEMVARANSPGRQLRNFRALTTDSDEETDYALNESDECVIRGRTMSLTYFKNVSGVLKKTFFPEPADPTRDEVELAYWKLVLQRTKHVCVYAAAVDSGELGLGFPKPDPKQVEVEPPWNLKVLSESSSSVLRSLGPVLGLTVPTIHLGMLFSTSCWNRDPHGLPWIEYQHSGAPKIWYGIPEQQSDNFKQAVKKLAPSLCFNKTIWLPSDVMMLPPSLLTENGVSLSQTLQEPGEFVVVFPKAYTSSICTGYSVSESVYFGPNDWLDKMLHDFKEAQDSCEPTMFPLEQLLLSIAADQRAPPPVLMQAYSTLKLMIDEESRNRKIIADAKVQAVTETPDKYKKMRRPAGNPNECDICRKSLYWSKVMALSEKESLICSTHAAAMLDQHLTRQLVETRDVVIVCLHSIEDLNQALGKLEARIFPTSE